MSDAETGPDAGSQPSSDLDEGHEDREECDRCSAMRKLFELKLQQTIYDELCSECLSTLPRRDDDRRLTLAEEATTDHQLLGLLRDEDHRPNGARQDVVAALNRERRNLNNE